MNKKFDPHKADYYNPYNADLNYTVNLGLCKGRHNLPVNDYIFEDNINPLDIEKLEEIARKKLQEYFEDKNNPFLKVTYMPTTADYTDMIIYCFGTLNLYVTGLTVALIAVLNVARSIGINVILWHYDRDNDKYYSQKVL